MIIKFAENVIRPPGGSKNERNSSILGAIAIRVLPLLIFTFVLFAMLVFSLNDKGFRSPNRYFFLVKWVRYSFYAMFGISVLSLAIYVIMFKSTEKRKYEVIAELNKKIARYVHD